MIKKSKNNQLKMLNNFDCLNLIFKNLCYIDIFSFKYTCKYLSSSKFALPNFKNIFIKKLLECNVVSTIEDALQFCGNLYNTGAYVAGSFILDCLLNTNYHNDIDIYDQTGLHRRSRDIYWFDIDNQTNLKFTQTLYKLGFVNICTLSETDGHLRSFINESNPEYIYNTNYTKNHDAYKIFDIKTRRCKNTIQIIPIDLKLRDNERSTIPRFIKSTFDLDICQNYFDGKHLYIKNIDKLIHKFDFIKPNTKFMRQVYYIENEDEIKNRLENRNNSDDKIYDKIYDKIDDKIYDKIYDKIDDKIYDKIDDKIDDEVDYEDKIDDEDISELINESQILMIDEDNEEYYENKNTEDRVIKYKNRGFNIKYHPKYDEIKLHIKETLENNKYCKIYGCSNFDNCTSQIHYRNNIKCISDDSINLSIYDF
jgi:hypothetical protein